MTENTPVCISRHWLESLSTAELAKLADSFGIDIPPCLERIFIIEELLENSNADNEEEDNNELKINPSYIEPVALPKQYNISYIEVIIRDPLWVFVFWEVKVHDREVHENAVDFKGYLLRVIPLKGTETEAKENSFTVPVGEEDFARYIGITEHSSQTASRYIIKLAVLRGNTELPIAVSKPFDLPKLIKNENINKLNQSPLLHLSGVQNISAIKSTDRMSRIKRQ
jgi:hypothetical protein